MTSTFRKFNSDWKQFYNFNSTSATNGANLRPEYYSYKDAFKHLDSYLHFGFGDSVLDVGCGTGLMVRYLSLKATMVHGVDYSDTAIKTASAFLTGVGGVRLEVRDVRNLGYQSEVFKYVICGGVIQYMESLEEAKKAVAEMYRVTSKGGKLFIYDIPDASKCEFSDGIYPFKPEELGEGYKYQVIQTFYEPEKRFDLLIEK